MEGQFSPNEINVEIYKSSDKDIKKWINKYSFIYILIYWIINFIYFSAVKQLIASKIKVFVYIIYVFVLCIFIMYI